MFSWRLDSGFGQKIEDFPFFYFGKIGQQNVFHDILERKIAFLAYKKKEFKRTKNWDIFEGVSPWFGSKNSNIFHRFRFSKINQENVFDDILEKKNPVLDFKKRSSKSQKIGIFPKGLVHGFG